MNSSPEGGLMGNHGALLAGRVHIGVINSALRQGEMLTLLYGVSVRLQ